MYQVGSVSPHPKKLKIKKNLDKHTGNKHAFWVTRTKKLSHGITTDGDWIGE
jgi:hypothetical protein